MARRRKKTAAKTSPWLVSYCDLVTLLLSFFVLLISMSVMDTRRTHDVMATVRESLGIGSAITTPLSDKDTLKPVMPGVFDLPADEMEPLRDMLWEDPNQDLTLLSNKYVEIISINADVLFAPGETALTAKGQSLLGRILPVLKKLDYPILLAGHTGPPRDELDVYRVTLDPYEFSATWEISVLRALSIYVFFKEHGLAMDEVSLEGFGEYRPKVSNNTEVGRTINRRVDIVLDKRGQEAAGAALPPDITSKPKEDRNTYQQDGFIFDVTPPRQE